MLTNIKIGCDSVSGNGTNNCLDITNTATAGYNKKVQYGQPVTVSVSAEFVWMLPLSRADSSGDVEVTTETSGLSDLDYTETEHNILIQYTVPGLKYYPDLN
jgi:hypothetical protein